MAAYYQYKYMVEYDDKYTTKKLTLTNYILRAIVYEHKNFPRS